MEEPQSREEQGTQQNKVGKEKLNEDYSTKNNSEGEKYNSSESNNENGNNIETDELDDLFIQLIENNQKILTKIGKSIRQLSIKDKKREEENKKIREENKQIKQKIENTNAKILKLEALVKRNNINLDLISNRDTLKSILVLFGINIGLLSKNIILKSDLLGNYLPDKKFSNLVCELLCKESEILNKKTGFKRQGFDGKENITEKQKIQDNLIFIICTIDNIVHSRYKNEIDAKNFISQLVGNQSISCLFNSLELFFQNPKSIDELIQTMSNYQINDDDGILLQDYDSAKNKSYMINNEYYQNLHHKNDYKETFFLQYIFSPGEKSINDTVINIDGKKFISKIKEVINDYDKANGKNASTELISKIKWN